MTIQEIINLLQTSIPLYTFIGASTLYLLNRLQKKQPFSVFTALNANMGAGAYPGKVLCDVVISSCLGTLIVIAITSPSTVPQAVIAGLGMTGVLSAHTTEIK